MSNSDETEKPQVDLRQTIDLRGLRFRYFASDDAETADALAYIDLRTRKMREYGWRDIPEGEVDHDAYDELGAHTVSILLQTESGELLAGTRLTRPKAPLHELMSVRMWGETPSALLEHEHLKSLHEKGQVVDNNRLLLTDTATPDQILILLGAGFIATGQRLTPMFTITEALHRFIEAIDLHMIVVHSGPIAGEQSVLGFFDPIEIFEKSGPAARDLLNLGAALSSNDETLFPLEAPKSP